MGAHALHCCKNPKWNNHVPFDSCVCGCVLFLRLFTIRMHFSERTILMLFLWSDYARPSLPTKLRARRNRNTEKKIEMEAKRTKISRLHGNGVVILSRLKMINWMCRSHLRARQSPSHKIIMASKWIINFFLLFTLKCFFLRCVQLRRRRGKKNKKKIYVKMLKAIVKRKKTRSSRCRVKLFHFWKWFFWYAFIKLKNGKMWNGDKNK